MDYVQKLYSQYRLQVCSNYSVFGKLLEKFISNKIIKKQSDIFVFLKDLPKSKTLNSCV